MRAALSTSRVACSLFRRAGYGFCYNWAPMDPRKHTTMNHSPHNMYLDLYEYGHYPDWYHVCSTAPKTYQSKVVNIIVDTINRKYGTTVTPDLLLSKRFREWNRFLGKDLRVQEQFHELYPTLLANLSSGIFVRESRLTWILEQKVRFEYTLGSFDANAPQTIEDFLERYNQDIEFLVLLSNQGFAAEIDQAESALQKHEKEEHYNWSPGVAQLKSLSSEHNNVFNRLLALLH